MRQIEVSDETYGRLSRMAVDGGFASVPALLDDVASDFFVLSRDTRGEIQAGIDSVERGELFSLDDVHAHLEEHRRQWLKTRGSV